MDVPKYFVDMNHGLTIDLGLGSFADSYAFLPSNNLLFFQTSIVKEVL